MGSNVTLLKDLQVGDVILWCAMLPELQPDDKVTNIQLIPATKEVQIDVLQNSTGQTISAKGAENEYIAIRYEQPPMAIGLNGWPNIPIIRDNRKQPGIRWYR